MLPKVLHASPLGSRWSLPRTQIHQYKTLIQYKNNSTPFHNLGRHGSHATKGDCALRPASSLAAAYARLPQLPGPRHSRQQCACCASAATDAGADSPEEQEGRPDMKLGSNHYWRVVLPTAMALLLCNMDRICLSVAMLPIAREMGWSEGVQGVVQSAFLCGYLATQLLGGTLADRYGGKLVMGVGVAWFSLASLLLPAAFSSSVAANGMTFMVVLVARFLVGFGEGMAMPAMNNLVARNIPPTLKATALGNCFTGFHAGNLVGLVLSPLILHRFGWRPLFYIFGLAGGPLLLIWLLTVPGQASQQEQQAPPISLLQLLSKPATWAIIVVNFINHFGYFIYLNWMPTYFYKVLGVDLCASAFLSFIPWLVMAIGSSVAGLLADGLVHSGHSVTSVRKWMQTAAFLGPVAALLMLANPTITAGKAVVAMAAALGITSFGQAGFVANMSDIAPQHAGRLFGLCNMFGCLAGIVGVSAAGLIVERTGSFRAVFHITAVLYILGTLVWNAFCTAEKQFG